MADTVADVLLARPREWDAGQIFGFPGAGINGLVAARGRQAFPQLSRDLTCLWQCQCMSLFFRRGPS